MTLRTLTRLWLFSRHLHNIGGIALWTPISHRTLFWAAMIFGPWTLLTSMVGIPFAGFGLTLHILLPGLATWWVIYVVDGGARPDQMVWSWVRYAVRCRPARRTGKRPSVVRVAR